jgi:hypothetical protein
MLAIREPCVFGDSLEIHRPSQSGPPLWLSAMGPGSRFGPLINAARAESGYNHKCLSRCALWVFIGSRLIPVAEVHTAHSGSTKQFKTDCLKSFVR